MTKSPLEGGKTQNEGGGRGGGRFWNFGFGNLVCSFRMFVYKCKQFFFFFNPFYTANSRGIFFLWLFCPKQQLFAFQLIKCSGVGSGVRDGTANFN